MFRKYCCIIWLVLGLWGDVLSQQCVFPGQTPVSAKLVCGIAPFNEITPTYCGQRTIPTPCNDAYPYKNTNPNFYRMACYTSGTLGFTIIPDEDDADYSWQLFDITNVNPESIFTIPSLFVACNWSADPGQTGTSSAGPSTQVCWGDGKPLFSKMPDIMAGRTYLLMVVNQSASSAGYQITFNGGTAVITDNVNPALKSARLNCDGTKIIVRLNKKMLCNSLAVNGSDFTVTGGPTVINAMPGDCSTNASSDSIVLTLDQPLLIGNYTLSIKTGSDGNTMSDLCNRQIVDGETIPLQVLPGQPTPMDSVTKPACGPAFAELVFSNGMRCNTFAPDGSDFIITGPSRVTIAGVTTNCKPNGLTSNVKINFSSPIITGGAYTITLRTGTDGNTIVDECGMITPGGANVTFNVPEKVTATFSHTIQASCTKNTVAFVHPAGNNVNTWQWDLGIPFVGNIPNPVIEYPATGGKYTVKLTVSNGACSDNTSITLQLPHHIKAGIEMTDFVCPGDAVTIENKSTGDIDSWNWDFGNGQTHTSANPPVQYFDAGTIEKTYLVQLAIANTALNCKDTAKMLIKVPVNCAIAVPAAFTPNGDGKNDLFYPLNGHVARSYDFKVFNRYGQVVFAAKDWTRKWDGTINGVQQPTGVYAWILSYTLADNGPRQIMKGTILLMR